MKLSRNKFGKKKKYSLIFRFAPWGSGSLNITQCRLSPYLPLTNRVSGLMLCNHTNTASLFQESLTHCETLFKKKAYLEQFLKVF